MTSVVCNTEGESETYTYANAYFKENSGIIPFIVSKGPPMRMVWGSQGPSKSCYKWKPCSSHIAMSISIAMSIEIAMSISKVFMVYLKSSQANKYNNHHEG